MGTRVETLLKDFKNEKATFKSFNKKLKKIIKDVLLTDNSIRIHKISNRIKNKSSFERKIMDDQKYTSLVDVTDISGLRIICYFDSDIDKISKLFENEFVIDYENSIDKRKAKSDTFGYKSMHYVISLKSNRLDLPEFSFFNGLKSEIQIRTILQHAWAEIEHDLGYKSTQSLPYEFRRTFSRISALLEAVDIEFSHVKSSLESYILDLPKLFESDFSEINLDKETLKYYTETSKLVRELAEKMATDSNVPLDSEAKHDENLLNYLKGSGILTVEQLNQLLIKEKAYLLTYFNGYWEKYPHSALAGIGIGKPIYQALHKMHGQD